MNNHLFNIHHKIKLQLDAICQEAGDMNVEEFMQVYESFETPEEDYAKMLIADYPNDTQYHKEAVSRIKVPNVTVGFIYWLMEHIRLRGLKERDIMEFPEKLKELQEKYNSKYSAGLHGWEE